MRSTATRGLRYMALSAFFFSIMSVFVKLAGDRIPAMEIVFIRSLLTLLFAYGALKSVGASTWGNSRFLLVMRGLAGFGGLSCFYYSLTRLPLADATVIQYTNPVLTAVIAAIFLGEGLSRVVVGGLMLSLVGVVLIAEPVFLFGGQDFGLDPAVVSVALMGALLSAVAYVLVRRLGRTEHPMTIVFYFPLISTPAAIPFVLAGFVWPSPLEWAMLLGVGITTHFGQVFLTRGLQAERAGRATSVGYLQMVFAFLWGMLLFNEIPSLWSFAGAGIIILSILAIARKRKRKLRTKHPPTQLPAGRTGP